MNWYIALGIKILFGAIILVFQVFIILGTFAGWLYDWVTFDENNKGLLCIVIGGILSFSITIPIACWIFNF